MSETSSLVLAALAGMMLGAMFFGGLWWTIRQGMTSPAPGPLFLGSFLLRTAGLVLGLYFVSQGDWHRMLACLLGFVAVRLVATGQTRRALALEGGTR